MRVIAEPENARSRRTRAALLAAARALIEEHGFEALTMAAVADSAGVSRRAVYLHYASRAELVTALFDYVSKEEELAASIQPVWAAPDAVTALDEWARHLARYHSRIRAVDLAAERVRQADPDAATHRQIVIDDQRSACRRLAGWLEDDQRLAPPWVVQTAADMLWALMSSAVIKSLLTDCGWPAGKYGEHIAVLLRSTFVRDRAASKHPA
jgi:AcrR family transcriptional regulator